MRDAVADLRRIAFLLERAQESTYRVRAFRTAAAALRGRSAEELARLHAAGGLTDLKGVGEVTARCVGESVAGEEPVYLRRLEDAVARADATGIPWRRRRCGCGSPCAGTATATPTPPTAAPRSPRWPRPRSGWATTTS